MTRSLFSPWIFIVSTIILATGCAQQSPSRVAISDMPPTIDSSYENNAHSASAKQFRKKSFFSRVLSGGTPDTIWERLVSLYSLPTIENKRIDQQLQWYLNHPNYIARIQKRAEPYLYFILNEVEEKRIPGEMALLPAVESAFRPDAYSRSHASGLWQFIPSTGRFFGLKQNWWYDGRRDVIASTKAATRYLKELSEEFNDDWLLALASYNAGKGNIHKAIDSNEERNLDSDYWSLDLRQETMDYVPRLLAIAKIFSDPEKYDIVLNDIPNEPYFEIVDIKSQLDLNKAVEMAQTSHDDFFMLNPAFNRWSTAPDGPHRLLIPVGKVDQFKNRLAHLTKHERMGTQRHKVRRGENLALIARAYNSSIEAIKQSNRLRSNTIHAGKVLLIPSKSKARIAVPSAKPKIERQFYTVKKGDTFWRIARKFSVDSKDLARWNKLTLKSPLRPGQKLIVKLSGTAVAGRNSNFGG